MKFWHFFGVRFVGCGKLFLLNNNCWNFHAKLYWFFSSKSENFTLVFCIQHKVSKRQVKGVKPTVKQKVFTMKCPYLHLQTVTSNSISNFFITNPKIASKNKVSINSPTLFSNKCDLKSAVESNENSLSEFAIKIDE